MAARGFLVYLPIAGHHPYATSAPGPFARDDEQGRYLNAIHEADAALGRLLDGLQRRALIDQTVVIAFGDHGEAFGQHEGNIAHSFFLYQENVRVPYLIAVPGRIEQSLRVRHAVSVVDTAPTVLELLGLPAPAGYEGASALESSARIAYFVTDYAQRLLGLVDGCWKLIYGVARRDTELYDLCRDPSESIDQSAAEPATTQQYVDRLEAWAAAQRASLLHGSTE